MNKTLSIGLAGYSFIIEENAYIKLSDYLAALRRSLEPEEAHEVMQDIEMRIVEILKSSLGKREVVDVNDVEKVIAQIGTPEQIDEQEKEYTSKKDFSYSGNQGKEQKQLFRDPEGKKIAGVAGGLANYLGVDKAWIRLAFIVLATAKGFGILIYVILWVILPEAKTTSDFLKMKGKPLNFDNLKEESNRVIQFTNESIEKGKNIYRNNSGNIEQAGSTFVNVIKVILGIFFSILSLSFLLGSFGVLFGSIGTSVTNIPEVVNFYFNDSLISNLILSFGFLTCFIPAVIFSLIAIKLFSSRTKLQYTGYLIGALVFIWFALISVIGFKISKSPINFTGDNHEEETVSINTKSDSLIIENKKIFIPENFKSYFDNIYSDGKTIHNSDTPDVKVIHKDNIAQPYLVIKKNATGYNQPMQLNVPVEVRDNMIYLPNYINYPYKYRFRHYYVEYELVVPKSVKVTAKDGIYIEDDTKKNDENDEDGNTINISAQDNSDSIIINGQKVAVKDIDVKGKKIIDKMEINKDSIKGIKLNIEPGKKTEVSIKTK